MEGEEDESEPVLFLLVAGVSSSWPGSERGKGLLYLMFYFIACELCEVWEALFGYVGKKCWWWEGGKCKFINVWLFFPSIYYLCFAVGK